MITVVGLGVEEGDISKRGEEAVLRAASAGDKIFVRKADARAFS